jgi:hypothetical protein
MTEQGLAVVAAHADRLRSLGAQYFVHRSLALGGYHHGISDVDLCVLLQHPLTDQEAAAVAASHERAGPLLSAAYVLDPPTLIRPIRPGPTAGPATGGSRSSLEPSCTPPIPTTGPTSPIWQESWRRR